MPEIYRNGRNYSGASYPSGGTTGQALVKRSNADADVEWADVGGAIFTYIVGATPFAPDWLSDAPGGTALTPQEGLLYLVLTPGPYYSSIYRYDDTQHVYLPVTNVRIEEKTMQEYIALPASKNTDGVVYLITDGAQPAPDWSDIEGIIHSYIVGSTEFASNWLSDTPGGDPTLPVSNRFYLVLTAGDYENWLFRYDDTTHTYISVSGGGGGASAAGDLASAFDSTASYAVGDYCSYDGQVYRFTAAHEGAWDEDDVVAVNVFDEMPETLSSDDLQDVLDVISGGSLSPELGYTPVGTIISYMGTQAPSNYLSCEGQVLNIDDYLILARHFEKQFGIKNHFGGDGITTFGIPDLRGEFLRGTGINGHENNGDGANVGVHQDGTHIPNIHSGASSVGTVNLTSEEGNSVATKGTADYAHSVSSGPTYYYTQSTHGSDPYDYFIPRPTNTSVLYCIATKDIYVDVRTQYSTDETVVGTWVDGKSVYQKTFTSVTPTTAGVDLVSGVDTFVNAPQIIRLYSSGSAFMTTGSGTNTTNFIGFKLENNILKLAAVASGYTAGACTVTIQYTKTTD